MQTRLSLYCLNMHCEPKFHELSDFVLTVAGGQNKQHLASKDTAKLDRETEELHHAHVGLDTSKVIQQARQAKGWTQKELATVSDSCPS